MAQGDSLSSSHPGRDFRVDLSNLGMNGNGLSRSGDIGDAISRADVLENSGGSKGLPRLVPTEG
jgi:hypothetical protein